MIKISATLWVIAVLFLLHQFVQKILLLPVPFIDSYFDPFAAAVLGLFILKMERQYLWKQKQFSFQWYEILVVTIVLALISEQLFPLLSENFTSDPLDYVSLAIGGIYFYLFLNKNVAAQNTKKPQKEINPDVA